MTEDTTSKSTTPIFKKHDFKVADEDGNVSYGTFPSRLKAMRERSGYTLEQVAGACDTTAGHISHIERASEHEALALVDADELLKFCNLFNVKPDLLIAPERYQDNLAEVADECMSKNHITRREMADRLGLKTTTALNNKLQGKTSLSFREAWGIARMFGVSMDALYKLDGVKRA